MREKFSSKLVLQLQNVVVDSVDEPFLQKLLQIIEDNMDDPEFGAEILAVKIAMSQTALYKK